MLRLPPWQERLMPALMVCHQTQRHELYSILHNRNPVLYVSFEDADILFGAHVLEDFGPHGNADFSQMGLLQQQH